MKKIIVDRMTDAKIIKGIQGTSDPTHPHGFRQALLCFSSIISVLVFVVSYDEDGVEVELCFFWLIKSE